MYGSSNYPNVPNLGIQIPQTSVMPPNQDVFGVPGAELQDLVRKIDNVLKNDEKMTVKTDSTFYRDFGQNFSLPKAHVPEVPRTGSPIRIQSKYQLSLNQDYLPQQNHHEPMNNYFQENITGGKKSLDSILREISKINTDLDNITPSAYTPKPGHYQQSHTAPRYIPLSKPSPTPMASVPKEDTLDAIIDNIQNLSKIQLKKPIDSRYYPQDKASHSYIEQYKKPEFIEAPREPKVIQIPQMQNYEPKEDLRERFERKPSRSVTPLRSNINRVEMTPVKYQPIFEPKENEDPNDLPIKEQAVEVKEEKKQESEPEIPVKQVLTQNRSVQDFRGNSGSKVPLRQQSANNYQKTLENIRNRTPSKLNSLEEVYRAREKDQKVTVQMSSKFINLPTNIRRGIK
ncbi:unnamed protein product [Moneuplotes crassus]|uniref:Uncharacterized protein n=1 Tax=Euplotes crassus TaxID=5936 RepID=A0AAD1UK45_EUPCR|nr:unnamed protein product [Moneuplotes crassus]